MAISSASLYRAASLLALAFAVSAAHAAPSLRVRAKVQLELQAERAGDGMRLHGTIRDDLAVPLAARELQLRVQSAPAQSRPQTRTLRSDAAGRFSVVLSARELGQRALVTFEGDDYYERAEASQAVDPERSELQLQFVQPSDWRVQLDRESTRIELRANSELGGANLPITIQDELARPIATGTTDASGALSLSVPNSRLGEAGLGELVASSEGDAARAPARVTQPVLRTRATKLSLSVRPDARAQNVHVAVHLSAASGPLAQRAVGVFVDGAHLITLLTDRRGDASRAFPASSSGLGEGTHRALARFESDAPGWLASQSEPRAFTIAAPTPRSAAWLIVPALASLAFVVWSLRRARGVDGLQVDLPSSAPSVRFGAADRGNAQLYTLDGHVEDAESGAPVSATLEIAAASSPLVIVRTDPAARFVSPALAPDAYRVRVHAAGYAGALFDVRVPHAGTASGIVVGLRSLRSAALDAHAPVARRVLRAEARLHVATVRDTFEAAMSGNSAGPPLARLTELVEHTAYARSTPNDRDLDEVQRAAAAALADLDARGSGSGDPSLEQ
jgi:hypothetical protein